MQRERKCIFDVSAKSLLRLIYIKDYHNFFSYPNVTISLVIFYGNVWILSLMQL